MDTNEKRHKITSIVDWINTKCPRLLAVSVALETEAPEICITHKDGGPVQLMRHRLQELDEWFTTIDHDYMVVTENLNGIPCLCFSFSI